MAQFHIKEGIHNEFAPDRVRWNGRIWDTAVPCFGAAIVFLFGQHRTDIRFLADHPESIGDSKVYAVEGSDRRYKVTRTAE
jgi:hypothetical protein